MISVEKAEHMSSTREKLTNELLYLYNTGKLYHAYRSFGAHIADGGVQFTLWAPDVRSVRVTGDFNGWNASDVMEHIGDTGVWTCFVPGAKAGDHYKYEIETTKGERIFKADPFAFMSVKRPGTDSIVTELWYEWNDQEWMKEREAKNSFTSPMNIYECHLGSWKRPEGKDKFYTYRELADMLVPYVKEMGYTHVEFLPVMEHPLDASWGYQVTGFYAPTSRYGSAHGLKHLIEAFHKEGIGVILDWVPGHFCPDDHGLRDFNGDKLYESIVHPDWGTYKFDFSRPQVRSFLLSNAMYWLEEYHADGLRVDGVTSMLFLNFGISDKSKMRFNTYGGDTDLDAVEFLKEFNYMIGTNVKGAFTVAEESTAWPMVTQPPSNGGLGFHYKWNMGWMNDTLEYMSTDFPWREGAHNKLAFSMTYAYSENYVLPLSHDEVVHGKKSLIGRMPGDIWRQFAGTRLLAMYQMTHPGKKLNFMGHEIAQFIEWREYEGLEWFLLGYENHEKHQRFIKDLNHIYTEHPALWSDDNSWEGFRWIDPDDRRQKVLTFYRRATGKSKDDPGELLICAFTMAVEAFDEFEIGVPEPGYYKEIINSDNVKYAGSGRVNTRQVRARKKPRHGMPYSIKIKMPVVGAAIFQKNYNRKGH